MILRVLVKSQHNRKSWVSRICRIICIKSALACVLTVNFWYGIDMLLDRIFTSPNSCFSPSSHLLRDSRCINGWATSGSPFREFPVFPFSISHPFPAPAAAICYLFSPVQRWLLHTPLPRPFPSLSVCPTALCLDCSSACTGTRELPLSYQLTRLKADEIYTAFSQRPCEPDKHQEVQDNAGADLGSVC